MLVGLLDGLSVIPQLSGVTVALAKDELTFLPAGKRPDSRNCSRTC